MKKKTLFSAIVVLFMWALAPAFASNPLLVSKSYWVDHSGTANLSDVRSRTFKPLNGTISEGYSPAVIWIKLTLSGQPQSEPLGLLVRPAFLRWVELYDPLIKPKKEGQPSLLSGRDAPMALDNHIGIDSGFVISTSVEPRDIYLRISSTTAVIVEIDLKPLNLAESNSHVTAAALALYLAFLLAFCLWGLVSWGVRRDSLYGLFTLRQLYSFAHIFVFYGLMRYFFADEMGPNIRDAVYNFITVSMIFIACFFDVRLIAEFSPNPRLLVFAKMIMKFPIVSIGVLAAGYTQTALLCNSIIVAITITTNTALAFSTRAPDDVPYARSSLLALRFGFFAMAFVVILPQLMFQNVLDPSLFFLKLLFSHAIISTITLFIILTIRARQRDSMAQASILRAQMNEQKLHQESIRRIEKERFLSMLTHELRNPLGVIRLMAGENSSGGQAVQKAALDMTRIIERVEQSENLDERQFNPHPELIDLTATLTNIVADHPASDRIQFKIEPGTDLVTDLELLQRIVRNLLDNADKYSPHRSTIQLKAIRAIRDGKSGTLLMFENVVGHAGRPDQDKVFTKYYRSKGAHRQPGSGLGLFLVASWSEALGGTVDYASSSDEEGTEQVIFSVWLPQ